MSPKTNRMLMAKREENCFAITAERKYYHLPQTKTFIKRSLRPREWQVNFQGAITVPRLGMERLRNEAATILYLQEHAPSIPTPKLLAAFEDDEAFYLITEYVEGVGMNELPDEAQKAVVGKELEEHLATLQSLRSARVGGPSGIIIPPYRALTKTFRSEWNIAASAMDEFVFCHNDLSQNNVIVDPETLEIKAIIDWEYAGFYPAWFEAHFFERLGPSVAIKEETDDSDKVLHFFTDNHRSK